MLSVCTTQGIALAIQSITIMTVCRMNQRRFLARLFTRQRLDTRIRISQAINLTMRQQRKLLLAIMQRRM